MQKTFSLSLAVCLTLAGCSQPSSSWNTVRSVRVDTRDSDDPSAVYAQHLSGALKSANVEHKIVTYEYRYRTALREEAVGTRSAVLYRDDRNPRNPWWLMDERLFKPVWLPGEDESRQVAFYLRQPATVLSSSTLDDDGKRMISAPDSSKNGDAMLARLDPVRKTERSARWTIFGRRPAQRFAAREIPTHHQPKSVRVRKTPASTVAPSRIATLFRARHGTQFDPASLVDRQKMEQLLLVSGMRSARLF